MKRSKIKSKRLREALDNVGTYRGGRYVPKPATTATPKPKAAQPSDGQSLRSGRSPDKPKPKPAKPASSTTPAKPKPKATTPKPAAPKPKPKPTKPKTKPPVSTNRGSGRDGSFGAGTSGSGRPSDGNPNPKPSQRSSPNRRSLRDRLLGTREEREYINEQGRRSAAESARRGRESRAPKEGQTRPQRIGGVGGRATGKTEVYRNGKWVVKK